jgi:nitronate monooxygenase
MFDARKLARPIVQAPMAGGISTPALAAAVCEAGGLGFLAAGYREPDAVAAEVAELRAATGRPFGLNLFAPSGKPADPAAVERYAARIAGEGELGEPRHDDDHARKETPTASTSGPANHTPTPGASRRPR